FHVRKKLLGRKHFPCEEGTERKSPVESCRRSRCRKHFPCEEGTESHTRGLGPPHREGRKHFPCEEGTESKTSSPGCRGYNSRKHFPCEEGTERRREPCRTTLDILVATIFPKRRELKRFRSLTEKMPWPN